MKSKILSLILLGIIVTIILSLGYKTEYVGNGLSISNIVVKEYSQYKGGQKDYEILSIMDQPLFSMVKGKLLSWYSQQPNEVLDQSHSISSTEQGNPPPWKFAQIFTAGINGSLSKVSLYLYRVGTPSIRVEIHGVDASGYPDNNVYAAENITIDDGVAWYNVTFSDPPTVVAGKKYAIVIYGEDSSNYLNWEVDQYNNYPNGYALYSSDGGTTWVDRGWDYCFRTYVLNGSTYSAFQITFDYSISPRYTVAYKSDVGRSLDTFNYTINVYHNVDNNQTWVLAWSVKYVNQSAVSVSGYSTPWISLLSGSYSVGWHSYYYKVEIVVEAFDSITGSYINKTGYVILSDEFYWQSIADYVGLASLVDTNLSVKSVIEPYAIFLTIVVILTYMIISRRASEAD